MTTEKTDAIAVVPETKIVRHVEPRTFSLMPSSLGEAREIATLISASDFAPKDYKGKPGNVIIAMQMGADLGLKPMQALQNIAVINGRPSIYGDAALALAVSVLERFHEGFEGPEGTDDFTAVCIAKRKGWPDETRRTFSIRDAKAAGLWGKAGPWSTYYKRMLQFRARGFTLRDVAADLLLGLVLVEEAQDYPEAIDSTVVPRELQPINVLDQLPEAIRDNVEKAFALLNLSPGLRLAKINEFFGKAETTPDEAAQSLLEWCRDEFAKRQGRDRVAKPADNSKTAGRPTDPVAGNEVAPASTQVASAPAVLAPPPGSTEKPKDSSAPNERGSGTVPVGASEIPWKGALTF